MKISEIITDKYKLRIPPTVYYDLLADVQEVEEKQEPILDKIKGYINHIKNTGLGKKKSLEFIEKFIDGLKAESEEGATDEVTD